MTRRKSNSFENQIQLEFDDMPTKTGESRAFLSEQIITYLGNKRSLLPFICKGVQIVKDSLGKDKLDMFDVFSGSGIVARSFKKDARIIFANDLELYSRIVNECYLSNYSPALYKKLSLMLEELRAGIDLCWSEGFITELYAPAIDESPQAGERVFYTRRNAQYIDTARQVIESFPSEYQKFFLAPLLSEASVHANTSGVFKGFYKDKNGIGCFGGSGKNALLRILGEIEVQIPVFSNFSCESFVTQKDAIDAIKTTPHVDIAYLDPPYNQHPYGSNYFMLNLIAAYQRPEEISKVSGIPLKWNRSPYNKPQYAKDALFEIVDNLDSEYILVSYNSEGFVQYEEFVEHMAGLGELQVFETQYNTFRGSRNLRNRNIHVKEYLFLLRKRGV